MSRRGVIRLARHDQIVPASRQETPLTGHVVAGFIDAEAHFRISEVNGGGSLSCGMTLAVRDDDIDVLFAFASFTGLGVVRRNDLRGNPQSAWAVYRKDEVVRLVGLLDQYPLRSRKRHDFAVWRNAVDAWVGTDPTRVDRMRELRRAIREARTYRPPNETSTTARLESSGLYDWLGGFIAGDGSFGIQAGTVRLTLRLRADDAPVLHGIASATSAGRVTGPHNNPDRTQ
jgi:hypothetical protein